MICAQTGSPTETRSLAAALASVLGEGDLLCLTGDLGAGKTCFTQGLASGLGIVARVTSPTFTLVSEYPASDHDGRLDLHHLDVYRLDGPGDALDLDIPDLLETGVTVVEWAERVAEILPENRLTIELRYPAVVEAEIDSSTSDVVDLSAIEFEPEVVRQLRLSTSGEQWDSRSSAIEQALADWIVPC